MASGLKSHFSRYTPICRARRVWHLIAQVTQTMMLLMRRRKSGLEIPNIFLALKSFPNIVSGIWGTRNLLIMCWVRFIGISCGRAHYLAHTYLIPPRGGHKSIPRNQVAPSTAITVVSSARSYKFAIQSFTWKTHWDLTAECLAQICHI